MREDLKAACVLTGSSEHTEDFMCAAVIHTGYCVLR